MVAESYGSLFNSILRMTYIICWRTRVDHTAGKWILGSLHEGRAIWLKITSLWYPAQCFPRDDLAYNLWKWNTVFILVADM